MTGSGEGAVAHDSAARTGGVAALLRASSSPSAAESPAGGPLLMFRVSTGC